jgi:high-affinity K+ transport system ATPase subunit B
LRVLLQAGRGLFPDELTIRITSDPGKGFIDRMIALVEGAERSKTPNEIALTVLLASSNFGISIRCGDAFTHRKLCQ